MTYYTSINSKGSQTLHEGGAQNKDSDVHKQNEERSCYR